jgi:hypothetical protein
MSGLAIILVSILLFALALAFQLLERLLQPDATVSFAGDARIALVIYAIAAIPALILWAFRRFAPRHARFPIILWATPLLLIGGLQVVARRPVMSVHAVLLIPRDCSPAARPADISAQQNEAYCSCAYRRFAERLDRSDVAKLRDGSAPPEIKAKIDAIEVGCRAEASPKD